MTIRDTVADLAERMDLPQDALTDAVRVTVLGRRRAVVEHHRGLAGYSDQLVEIEAGRGERVRVLGIGLELRAMDRETLIVTGTISAVEYA